MNIEPKFAWTHEVVADLERRYEAGDSATQIAKALKPKGSPGPSRNAVIGKLHRLGLRRALKAAASAPRALAPKPAPVRLAPASAPVAIAPTPSAPPAAVVAIQGAPASLWLPMLRIATGQCRFPGEEATDRVGRYLFCAAPVAAEGAVYCRRHAAICFSPSKPKPLKSLERLDMTITPSRRAA